VQFSSSSGGTDYVVNVSRGLYRDIDVNVNAGRGLYRDIDVWVLG
jgi:hypothetical protein